MKYLHFFDLLNLAPKLYINKKDKYSSSFGSLTGMIIVIACIGFSIYFIYQFLNKDNGNVIFNEIMNFDHYLNLTQIPFIFKITNSKGVSYSDKIVKFRFQHWKLPHYSKGVPIISELTVEKCNFSKHLIHSNYKNLFSNIDFESYYCLNLNGYDLTIDGMFGDLDKGYSYINLYLNECQNSSSFDNNNSLQTIKNSKTATNNSILNENQCMDKNEILKQIGDLALYLRIAYVDFEIDHSNFNNPYKPFLKSDAIAYTYKSKLRIFYYFKNVFYNTDVGYFDKDNKLKTFYTFDNFQITYPQITYTIREAFGVFSILISNKGNEYNKSFTKIQILIANIGGVIKGITLIFEFMVQYISKKSMVIYFANHLFDSSENKNEKDKKIFPTKKRNLKFPSNYLYNGNINHIGLNNSNININNSNIDFYYYKENKNIYNYDPDKRGKVISKGMEILPDISIPIDNTINKNKHKDIDNLNQNYKENNLNVNYSKEFKENEIKSVDIDCNNPNKNKSRLFNNFLSTNDKLKYIKIIFKILNIKKF